MNFHEFQEFCLFKTYFFIKIHWVKMNENIFKDLLVSNSFDRQKCKIECIIIYINDDHGAY